MAKKHKKHEEHVDESWLIPYADILTLLLALFIVLFAASEQDQAKLDQMAASFNPSFSGSTGILDNPSNVPLDELPEFEDLTVVSPGSEEELFEGINDDDDPMDQEEGEEYGPETERPDIPFEEAFQQEMDALWDLQQELERYIEEEDLQASLQTFLTEQGLTVTILNHALFESGSAEVRSDATAMADEISAMLVMEQPRHITVAGHTDTVPISNDEFRDNWDLSSMRSLNFMKAMLDNDGHDPEYFSATGHGEYQPLESNSSSEGRERNRRVEVTILPTFQMEEAEAYIAE